MKHDRFFIAPSGSCHPRSDTLDRWRAGMLSGHFARRIAAHVGHCPRCEEQCAFSKTLLDHWSAGYQPHHQSIRRSVTIWRLPVAAKIILGFCAIALVAMSLHVFSPMPHSTPIKTNESIPPEAHNIVAHLGFYEWLEAHPDKLNMVNHGY